MPEVIINNVPVDFPFEPYDVQKVYMEKVIECLQKGINGVLESPTGTGKTLSLLCASLGWLRVKKAQIQAAGVHQAQITGFQAFTESLTKSAGAAKAAEVTSWAACAPKIIYASRTHTQLTQALSELKRTNYAQTIRAAVLGSRDQLCIHGDVIKEQNNNNKIQLCQRYVSARSCLFYNNVESRKEHPSFTQSGILDIEDLVAAGKKNRCCPYYMARELKTNADIIFMPYNYLLDPKARKANSIELDNCIVILDEAHNIEKMCEEAASLHFRSTDIALCIDEVTKIMRDLVAHNESNGFNVDLSATVKDFSQEDLCIIKTMFLELEKAVDEIEVSEEGSTYPGSFMFDILSKASITHGKRNVILEIVDKMVQYLSASATSAFTKQGAGLQRFSELLTVVFNQDHRSLLHSVETCYKVFVTFEEPKNKTKKTDNWLTKKPDGNRGRVINYWCFSSSFGMQMLSQQGVRCILLTSGTLSPIPALISELGIKVPITLENGHVVTGDQVFVSVVSTGPDGTNLNSSYNTRNDPKYIASLGRTIQNFSRVVPGGLLIFFPSYPVLKKCQDEWQATGIWPKIAEQKAIFVESQSKDTFSNNMADYYERIHSGDNKGACFLAVCRGKVSEGLDFSDNNGRAVIITGLPYPPLKDPRVMLKQKYLDGTRKTISEGLSGQQWYQLEASRAVNQAIGRVIRHRNDFGAILLCDSRFGNPNFKQQLSTWIQPHIQSYSNFGSAYKGVIDFFKKAAASLPSVQTKLLARRPETRGDGTNIEPTVQRPTAAAFEQARSRVVSRPTTVAAEPALSTSQITANVLNNSYGSPTGISPSPLKPKIKKRKIESEDFFSALGSDKPSHVIDFHERINVDVKLPEFTHGRTGTGMESVSRRKLVLAPSSGANKIGTNSLSSKTYSMNSKTVANKTPSETRQDIAAYCLKIKNTLQPNNYKIFAENVKSYNKEPDFQKLLAVLTKLFLKSEPRYPNLFRDFARFLKPHHREEFHDLCKSMC